MQEHQQITVDDLVIINQIVKVRENLLVVEKFIEQGLKGRIYEGRIKILKTEINNLLKHI